MQLEVGTGRLTFPFDPLPGHANASFCPHGYGCRTLVLCEGQTMLDVTDNELTVTVRVPEGRWLWLVSLRAGVSFAEWFPFTPVPYLWVSA